MTASVLSVFRSDPCFWGTSCGLGTQRSHKERVSFVSPQTVVQSSALHRKIFVRLQCLFRGCGESLPP